MVQTESETKRTEEAHHSQKSTIAIDKINETHQLLPKKFYQAKGEGEKETEWDRERIHFKIQVHAKDVLVHSSNIPSFYFFVCLLCSIFNAKIVVNGQKGTVEVSK